MLYSSNIKNDSVSGVANFLSNAIHSPPTFLRQISKFANESWFSEKFSIPTQKFFHVALFVYFCFISTLRCNVSDPKGKSLLTLTTRRNPIYHDWVQRQMAKHTPIFFSTYIIMYVSRVLSTKVAMQEQGTCFLRRYRGDGVCNPAARAFYIEFRRVRKLVLHRMCFRKVQKPSPKIYGYNSVSVCTMWQTWAQIPDHGHHLVVVGPCGIRMHRSRDRCYGGHFDIPCPPIGNINQFDHACATS